MLVRFGGYISSLRSLRLCWNLEAMKKVKDRQLGCCMIESVEYKISRRIEFYYQHLVRAL